MITKLNLQCVINGKNILNISDKEFKKFNLIYGYNGSGKTTFSRFFHDFAETKVSSKYQNASINNTSINNVLQIKNQLGSEILVYNTDYIKRVIYEENQKQFKFYIGSDASHIISKIKQLNSLQGTKNDSKDTKTIYGNRSYCNDKFEALKKDIDQISKKFDEEFTKQGGIIYTKLKFGSREKFDKGDIRKIINSLSQQYQALNSKDAERYNSYLDTKEVVKEFDIKFSDLAQAINDTNKLLSEKVIKSIDPKLSAWIAQGFEDFYKDKHDKDCKFCGNHNIGEDKLKEIQAIAESKYLELTKNLGEKISNLNTFVANQEAKINKIIIRNQDNVFELVEVSSNLNDDAKKRYTFKQQELITAMTNFLKESEIFKTEHLEQKKNNSENDMSYTGNLSDTYNAIKTVVDDINTIIKEDNELKNDGEKNKQSARSELKKHYVYEFITTNEYLGKINQIKTELKSKIQVYNKSILKKNRQLKVDESNFDNLNIYSTEAKLGITFDEARYNDILKKINAKLKTLKDEQDKSQQDIAVINQNIKFIIGERGFQITPEKSSDINMPEKCYKIRRDASDTGDKFDPQAFSEGEKTAIAFAFFLANVKSLADDNKSIIVIMDDPICSLDQNIIYNIYGQIVSQVLKSPTAQQVFILTHNYHFAYLMNRQFDRKSELSKHLEVILNIKSDNTIMNNYNTMQLSNGNFLKAKPHLKDEYQLLCEYIKELSKKNNESEIINDYDILIIGNLCRKLCEQFSKFKTKCDDINNPNIISAIDQSLLVDNTKKDELKSYVVSINRFINDYSHKTISDFFEDSLTQKQNIAKMILDVIRHIDEVHYNSYFL
jgi:wobble nucleotide-excising tRNase